jgi:hypothetical protein
MRHGPSEVANTPAPGSRPPPAAGGFSLYPWREGWRALDPRRPCYTCGAAPSSTFHDGSPSYRCSHDPIYEINPTIDFTPMVITYTLTPRLIKIADREWERTERRREGQRPRFEHPARRHNRQMSTRAEVGLAAELDLPWMGSTKTYREWWASHDTHPPDIGEDIEVRFNPYVGSNPYLRMWREDYVERRYVLVQGGPEKFTAKGWCWGYEGKLEEYWIQTGEMGTTGSTPTLAGNFAVPIAVLRLFPLE